MIHNPSDIFPLQLMSKEIMAPFGAELSGDLEQQVSDRLGNLLLEF